MSRRPLATAGDALRHVLYKQAAREMAPEVATRMRARLEPMDPQAEVDYAGLLWEAQRPDPPVTVYHCTFSSKRAAIEREGLEPRRPIEHNWQNHSFAVGSQPRAVYVAESPMKASMWLPTPGHVDVWAFEIEGLAWIHDPLNLGCWAVLDRVPSGHLRLVVRENRAMANA